MNKSKKITGYYDYTVILTYLGLLSAFWGILLAIQESFLKSIILLMISGVCDMFDGTVAATKDRNKYERLFGIQIDSLSDLISFGLLPAIFTFMLSNKNGIMGLMGAIYVLAALIRLAYFNVCEEERQKETCEKRTEITGVPVTVIAALLPIVFLVHSKLQIVSHITYIILLALCSIGFLSPIKIRKPNLIGKICIIIVGLCEMVGIFFLGWDLV